MDLAAPSAPSPGLKTSVHFTDLLEPGDIAEPDRASVASINPGILVENGVIHYQLLRNQLVKVERGEWPFMGGRLILHETVLNFGRPSAKRLTFELQGFDAKMFIDSLGFQGWRSPEVRWHPADDLRRKRRPDRRRAARFTSAGRGVQLHRHGAEGGHGGRDNGFDLLSDIRYQSMIIRLDGDLAGEFATRFTIDDVSLGRQAASSPAWSAAHSRRCRCR